ncbi:response regulator [Nannocystis bainbridge]|uniref:Response regulator n=2 Tax=Nannocystis bainbridge TaxID=2995303 RepID=A0ABT5E9T2_9BACT|nr:response regulator [Nannocystis bainbridge]MDC0718735.1 response regulator [Nannocystis bainbridge]MDC0722609.1 response regulator [Nannocystis bainbridge]
MADAPKPAKIATFGVRFESYDDFLVEYTDNLRRGFLLLPGVRNLETGQPVRVKLSLPNRAILYLSGTAVDLGADGGKGTLIQLAAFTAEQERIFGLCVNSVLDASTSPQAEPPPSRALNVLLVDDSPSVRAEMAAALRERGLNVTTADNGLMAISAALKSEPDLLLTDVEMPEMDGWTLLRMARGRKKLAHVPIVFLTALSDDMSRLQGYRMGVDDFLPKNLSADEIVARLQGVVARRTGLGAVENRGLRGDLQHVRLGSVLSFLEAEKKTGDLRLDSGQDSAVLRLVQGVLRDVKNLGYAASAIDRVFDLLGWEGGHFEFFTLEPRELGDLSLAPLSVTWLLMEHARREDEANESARRERLLNERAGQSGSFEQDL